MITCLIAALCTAQLTGATLDSLEVKTPRATIVEAPGLEKYLRVEWEMVNHTKSEVVVYSWLRSDDTVYGVYPSQVITSDSARDGYLTSPFDPALTMTTDSTVMLSLVGWQSKQSDTLRIPVSLKDAPHTDLIYASDFCLYDPYPNPFGASISQSFFVAVPCRVSVQLYNISDSVFVETVFSPKFVERGSHQCYPNVDQLSSGCYISRLYVNGRFASKARVVLIK